jgi:hypothetical protein
VEEFMTALTDLQIAVMLRVSRGNDIAAACGQLIARDAASFAAAEQSRLKLAEDDKEEVIPVARPEKRQARNPKPERKRTEDKNQRNEKKDKEETVKPERWSKTHRRTSAEILAAKPRAHGGTPYMPSSTTSSERAKHSSRKTNEPAKDAYRTASKHKTGTNNKQPFKKSGAR